MKAMKAMKVLQGLTYMGRGETWNQLVTLFSFFDFVAYTAFIGII